MIDECAVVLVKSIDYRLAQLDMTDTKHQAGLSAGKAVGAGVANVLKQVQKVNLVRECLKVKVKELLLWKLQYLRCCC